MLLLAETNFVKWFSSLKCAHLALQKTKWIENKRECVTVVWLHGEIPDLWVGDLKSNLHWTKPLIFGDPEQIIYILGSMFLLDKVDLVMFKKLSNSKSNNFMISTWSICIYVFNKN